MDYAAQTEAIGKRPTHGAQGLRDHKPGLEELSQHFEVIAPEHPGFGLSDICDDVDDVSDLALF
jgi:pimeloyl-ACP methyl ester carboxylesterase